MKMINDAERLQSGKKSGFFAVAQRVQGPGPRSSNPMAAGSTAGDGSGLDGAFSKEPTTIFFGKILEAFHPLHFYSCLTR